MGKVTSRAVVKAESEKPENQDREIKLDAESREVLRDGVVIDFWKAKYFTS